MFVESFVERSGALWILCVKFQKIFFSTVDESWSLVRLSGKLWPDPNISRTHYYLMSDDLESHENKCEMFSMQLPGWSSSAIRGGWLFWLFSAAAIISKLHERSGVSAFFFFRCFVKSLLLKELVLSSPFDRLAEHIVCSLLSHHYLCVNYMRTVSDLISDVGVGALLWIIRILWDLCAAGAIFKIRLSGRKM